MKKLLSLLVVSILVIGTLHAQSVTKGTKMFSPQLTNIGFNSVSYSIEGEDESAKISRLGLSAAAGYAIMDNLMIVGTVAFQSFKFEESKLSAITLGASARKYFDNGFFAGAGVNLINGKIGSDGDHFSTTMIDGLLNAGYSFEIFPKLAIEPIITFSTKIAGGEIKDFDAKLKYTQLSLSIGFSYYF